MPATKNVFAIVGSAGKGSSNGHLVKHLASIAKNNLQFSICDYLHQLPHFDPALSLENTPQTILDLRSKIAESDAVLICTPEYIFSLPSGLKNLFEWCVATTVFSAKPVGLITASAHGVKGHEELKLIMKTVGAHFTNETTLLIQGIKGKVDAEGHLTDEKTKTTLQSFVKAFDELIDKSSILEQ